MNHRTWLLGLVAAALVAGCAKAPAPAAAQEEETTNANVPEPVAVSPPEDSAKQAGILAQHIDPRPECAQYLQPLEAASKAAPGTPAASIDMTAIMAQAQSANCTRK